MNSQRMFAPGNYPAQKILYSEEAIRRTRAFETASKILSGNQRKVTLSQADENRINFSVRDIGRQGVRNDVVTGEEMVSLIIDILVLPAYDKMEEKKMPDVWSFLACLDEESGRSLLTKLVRIFDPGAEKGTRNRPDMEVFRKLVSRISWVYSGFDWSVPIAEAIRDRSRDKTEPDGIDKTLTTEYAVIGSTLKNKFW